MATTKKKTTTSKTATKKTEKLPKIKFTEKKKIVFCLTGTGYFDLKAYSEFNNNTMRDYIPTDADLQKGFDSIPIIKE